MMYVFHVVQVNAYIWLLDILIYTIYQCINNVSIPVPLSCILRYVDVFQMGALDDINWFTTYFYLPTDICGLKNPVFAKNSSNTKCLIRCIRLLWATTQTGLITILCIRKLNKLWIKFIARRYCRKWNLSYLWFPLSNFYAIWHGISACVTCFCYQANT